MENYPKMYAIVCSAASLALDAMPINADNIKARLLLERALMRAEEVYCACDEDEEAYQ